MKKSDNKIATQKSESSSRVEFPKLSAIADMPENYHSFIHDIKNTIANAR